MMNPVTVLTTLLSVEFVLYTMSLCSPQWLVQTEGASEGLFALCSEFDGFSSCTAFPAWLAAKLLPLFKNVPKHGIEGIMGVFDIVMGFRHTGSYSLSWMFLSASSLLSLTAVLTVRPALTRGRKAIAALFLNITSVALCAGSLIAFLVSIKQQEPELLQHLGWTFYICCATLVYASLVTFLLGVIHGDGARVEPVVRGVAVGLSVIAA